MLMVYQCEHILLTSCWNSIATSVLHVCYNLCVFTCVREKFAYKSVILQKRCFQGCVTIHRHPAAPLASTLLTAFWLHVLHGVLANTH